MLSKERVRELKETLEPLSKFAGKQLVKRPDQWGTINFEQANDDIEAVISIATDLLNLPLEMLTENSAQNLSNQIPPVLQVLKDIDQFAIDTGDNPGNRRDALCNQLHASAEALQDVAYRFMPYLAYRHGDIAENREKVETIARQAEDILEETKAEVESRKKAIEEIVRQAREASASAGVATFTADFGNEADKLQKRSKIWLLCAAGLGIITIGAATLFYFWPEVSSNAGGWETLRNVGSKAAIIAVLFTSAVWCSRIYRALVHQATVNKHRAMSMKTFQAFVEATETSEVRDAVLLAATNAAFGNVPTGLVEQSYSDGPVNVTEVRKHPAGSIFAQSGE